MSMHTAIFIFDSYEQLLQALRSISDADVADIYALSFYLSNADDDPRKPELRFGYNTETNYEATISSASSEAEARWNFAFWLQNDLTTVKGEDWATTLPEHYSDQQAADDFEECMELGGAIEEQFNDIMIAHARRLHKDGVIREKFGRAVPIIVHELEYYDVPLEWTRRANPSSLITDFEAFVNRGL